MEWKYIIKLLICCRILLFWFLLKDYKYFYGEGQSISMMADRWCVVVFSANKIYENELFLQWASCLWMSTKSTDTSVTIHDIITIIEKQPLYSETYYVIFKHQRSPPEIHSENSCNVMSIHQILLSEEETKVYGYWFSTKKFKESMREICMTLIWKL